MAAYDNKLITGLALTSALTRVKTELDKKLGAVQSVTAGNLVMFTADGKIADSGKKIADFQTADDILTSLSGITAASGILSLSAVDTVEARLINDGDINNNTALYYAIQAFINKDGSIKLSGGKGIVDSSTGDNIIIKDGDDVVVGKDGKKIYIGTKDNDKEILGKGDIESIIDDKITASSHYLGKHELFTKADTLANAKARVEGAILTSAIAGITAIVFGEDDANNVTIGEYNGTSWSWETYTPAFVNGDMIYFVEELTADNYNNQKLRYSGRAIYNVVDGGTNKFDVIIDKLLQPDGTSITTDTNGRVCIATKTITTDNGTITVPASFGASSIEFDSTRTIKDVIDDLKLDGDTVVVVDPENPGEEISLQDALDDIGEKIDGKIDLVVAPVVGNFPTMRADGMLEPSTIVATEVLVNDNRITTTETEALIADIFN